MFIVRNILQRRFRSQRVLLVIWVTWPRHVYHMTLNTCQMTWPSSAHIAGVEARRVFRSRCWGQHSRRSHNIGTKFIYQSQPAQEHCLLTEWAHLCLSPSGFHGVPLTQPSQTNILHIFGIANHTIDVITSTTYALHPNGITSVLYYCHNIVPFLTPCTLFIVCQLLQVYIIPQASSV